MFALGTTNLAAGYAAMLTLPFLVIMLFRRIFLMPANRSWTKMFRQFQRNWSMVVTVIVLVSICLPCRAQCVGNAPSTPITSTDETSSIPSSRQLVNGSGTTVNLSTPGQISINATSAVSVATYLACNPQYTVPATPGEMITIYGSATKTVKILKLRLRMEQTTAGTNLVYLHRRNSAASGGTANAVTTVKCDTTDPSATATMNYYTANPTAGGSDGKILDAVDVQSPAAASNLQPNWQDIYNADYAGKPIILSGTAQGIGLNLNGVALPTGLKVQLQVVWTEE
jgi:hypothetical protein